MNLLLDTHILLWWLNDSPDLKPKTRKAISNTRNQIWISSGSIWEIRTKESLGKLIVPANFCELLWQQGFQDLPISASHVNALRQLPPIHKDPFDRIQIAQAIVEKFTIVSADSLFKDYPVSLIVN